LWVKRGGISRFLARLFAGAGASFTRSDRRQRELEFESPLPPLAPPRRMKRRDGVLGFIDSRGLAPEKKRLTLGFEPVTAGYKT